VLSGLLERLNLADKSTPILRALDKLTKIGRENVAAEMAATAGATAEQAESVLALAEISGTNDETLSALDRLVAGSEKGQQGVARLSSLVETVMAAGVSPDRLKITPSIARGLDYYTGTIYETFLDRLPQIGSVCSGGRYDNLAELYTSQHLPGVGASLGLDRLLSALEELGMLEKTSTPAPVFIPYFDGSRLKDYVRLAAALRAGGIGVEVYPDAKKLGQQLKYADRRGFHVALIMGESEFASGQCQIKNLKTTESQTVAWDAGAASILEAVRGILAASP
jgi:histidyl-tRNA synthetase